MAIYDQTDLTTRIRDLLNEASESYWLDTTIANCINRAQRILAVNYGAQQAIESLTCTIDDRAVAITGFFVAHVEVYNPAGKYDPLSRISKAQYGRRALMGGQPQYYYQEESNVIIDPEPKEAFSLTAYTFTTSTDMTSGSATPSIASIFIPSLILMSTAFCMQTELSDVGYQALLEIASRKASHANYDYSVVAPDALIDLMEK